MIYQIEITTHCNFQCFYCVGRTMPQKHMDKIVFSEILQDIPAGTVVNLQGEGESALHPAFWEFVDQVVSKGCYPFTMTNGTLINKSNLKSVLTYFPQLGISLDSLDDVDTSGRYHQKAVLSKIDSLVEIAGIMYLTIYITDYGQNISPLIQHLESKKIKYIVQSLQTKPDYVHSSLYESHLQPEQPIIFKEGAVCKYILQDIKRFYNVDGLAFPCCFIKDTSKYKSIEALKETFNLGEVPEPCFGCRELTF